MSQETRGIVQRLGLLALDSLQADLAVNRDPGSLVVHVRGRIDAIVRQACVVTTEPVESNISESFEAWFADPEAAVSFAKARHNRQAMRGHGEVPLLDESEDPEPIMDGKIDLGELVTQHLSLFIDPYPHAEGAQYEKGDDSAEETSSEIRKNPFGALQSWKDKLKEGKS